MLWFDPLPPVKIRVPNGMQDVSNVEAALEAMRKWPVRKKLKLAYIICARAIDDPTPDRIEAAREAFVEAARESGMLR